MAFLQSEIPPSTAPGSSSARVPAIPPAARRTAAVKPRSRKTLIRLSTGLLGGALLLIPGYAAAQATESIAMGILAADLVFLLLVAGWSSVAGTPRR